jgi:RNA polymerase sigma factor (sigma-70 family)
MSNFGGGGFIPAFMPFYSRYPGFFRTRKKPLIAGINFPQHGYSSGNVRRGSVIDTDCDAGERSARFQQMALPHLDAAFNLARWLCGNPNDAEDIVQDAYIRAFRYFDMFHGDNARPWLLTIVRRTWYTEWQKREMSRNTVEFDENLDDTLFEGWSEPQADPETLMMRDQDARLVHAALEQLPNEYREVMVLRELEELSYREIAEIADLPVGTVMSRLARGRRRLAALLAAQQGRAVPQAAASRGASAAAAGGTAAGATGAPGAPGAPGASTRAVRDKRCGVNAAAAPPLAPPAGTPPAGAPLRAGERPGQADRGAGNDQPIRAPGATPGGIAQESPDGL